MSKKKVFQDTILFISFIFIFSIIFYIFLPKTNPQLTKSDFIENKPSTLSYVALGDSLTEGVGDTTKQGGFVSLLADKLESSNHYLVKSSNFGVAGNTSNQILKRMTKDKAILKKIKKADFMTLTVGGNDVMAVIRKNLTHLELSAFSKPQIDYQKRLRKIIDLARRNNETLPIYILGIYNPFYLNFPDIVEMQELIGQWNDSTENVAKEYQNVYFVPINDLLYKGYEGQEAIDSSDDESLQIINNTLFEEDHFHPNNIGYQIIANAMMEKINETRSKW